MDRQKEYGMILWNYCKSNVHFRIMIFKTFLRIFSVYLLLLLFSDTALADDVDSNAVSIEDVVIVGDPQVSKTVIYSALEIEKGDSLTQEQLSNKLSEAEDRLRSLEDFEILDISLERGSKRDFYRVKVFAKAKSAYYFGLSNTAHGFKATRSSFDTYSHAHKISFGNRNFLNTGLLFDISAGIAAEKWESPILENGNVIAYNDQVGRDRYIQFNLIYSRILGSHFFAGPSLNYIEGYQGNDVTVNRVNGVLLGGEWRYGLVGIRFNESITPNGYRVKVGSIFTLVSNKPYLNIVEPGWALNLRYGRPVRSVSINYFDASAHHTFLSSQHAFSPTIDATYDTGPSGESNHRYDFGLRYENIAIPKMIYGLELGYIDAKSDFSDFLNRDRFDYRLTLFYKYRSRNFLYDIALSYGVPRQSIDYSTLTRGQR
ncbi:MAG: hypothetical protein AB7T49_18160 [Oligoflexales bacterium]